MAIDVDKLISDVRNDVNAKPNQAKTSDGKPVIVKGNAKTTQGKKTNTTPKDTDKPLGRASGQRAFTSTPKGDTKGESTLKAAGTGAAAAYTYLKGLLDEIDAQTKARDEADSARLKAGRDAAEQGVDINTADGGLKKAHEEQQKDFEARAAKYAGVGEDEFKRAQELYTKSAEYEATAKEGLGKVGQFAVDLGIAGTQFAGDMALNTILPGAGLAAMGARAAGQGAYSASLEGKDINEQLTSGLKSAAVEVLTEKLFGLGSKAAYGAGIVKNKNLVNAVVNRLAKTDKGRTALKLLVGANEEGLEEVLADVLNPVADRLLKLDDGKGDWSDLGEDMDVEQMLYDYLLGASLGLAGSSANIVNGSFSAENKAQRDKEVYQRALVDSGLESAEGTKSRELAEEADKILSKSEKRGRRYLTDKEVEALREANIEAIAAEEATQTAQEAAKPRAASDVVADVAAGKVGAQEPTQQATSAPTMEKIIAAMTGKPFVQTAASVMPNNASVAEDNNGLPPGMGAASAEFTGEMSPAEQWVAEAQAKGDSALHPISDEQQRNLAEQQSRAPQELPKIDPTGNLTSKMAQTVMNSGVTPQEMSDAILNDAYDGRFSRIAYSDSEAINKAENEIENGEGRYQGALERWKGAVERGEVSKDNIVMGICLYNNAVTNGDYTTALDILDGLVVLGKNTGQALHAVRILNKISPEGRLYVAAKAVDRINRDVKKRYGDKAPDISVDEGLYADYADALKSGDEAKIKSAWEAVEQNIADQIPANWADKLNAWRYLAMLGNVRTHARNFFGNAGFMPVRMMKNAIGAGIEGAVDALSKDGINRTKAFLNPADAADRALFHVAWADFSNAREAILSGGKYDDDLSGVNDRRTIFKFKLLEGARKDNTKLLNVGDAIFSQPAYAESLASWLKANGITAAEYTSESFDMSKKTAAMEYAIKEAQKATYRDINFFSEFVTSMRVKTESEAFNKGINAVISGVLPFRKTPANILVRAVEYSPAGLAKTIFYDGFYKLRKDKITAAEFIDNLSEGLTGTALVGLGVFLAKIGILTGGDDDDDKQSAFDKLRGKLAYSVVIGDKSYTIDWLAPENMPVFIGVEIFNRVTDKSDSGFDLLKTLGAIYSLTNPMLDMSMLQGVNELLSGLDYGDGDPLSTVIVTAVGSLISQFVPTIFGQIERVFTPTRQTAYIDRESKLPPNVQRYIGNLSNKIPGWDYNQIDYIDAWGRTEETGGVAERLFNNLVNPANVKQNGETWVDDELQRLYDLGETGVFPQKAAQDTKINGEHLSADEYVTYAKERGSTSLKGVQELIRRSAYKNMSDADKAAAINNVYAYADGVAKLKVNRNAEVESWISKAKDSGNPSQYITDQIYLKSVDSDGNGSYNNAETVRGLINGGYSGDKLISKVREYMTTESGNCELADLLERTQGAKIDDSIALDVYEFKSSARNDKNADGKVTKSVKDKVKEYIGSLSIPAEQKNVLYYSFYKKW